jgi:threonine dehydratase
MLDHRAKSIASLSERPVASRPRTGRGCEAPRAAGDAEPSSDGGPKAADPATTRIHVEMSYGMEFRHEVEAARARIAPHIRLTPVELSRDLTGPGNVWLKLENQQLTGSFKLRGATNKILSLSDTERSRGVVAASSGNHGAAVACAATAADCPALIFVPENVAPGKLATIRSWGVEARLHGDDCVLAELAARRHAEAEGMTYISPYNDATVVAGQGTLGAELAEQLPPLDAVFIALGGGGLISGVGGYLKTRYPDLEVVACSPEHSPVMHASLAAGRIVEMESLPTLSDGTAGGVEPDAITFELCRRLVDESLLVSEQQISGAMRWIVEHHHTLVEGAAAVAVAAYLDHRQRYSGKNVAIVLCGANIDAATLRSIL